MISGFHLSIIGRKKNRERREEKERKKKERGLGRKKERWRRKKKKGGGCRLKATAFLLFNFIFYICTVILFLFVKFLIFNFYDNFSLLKNIRILFYFVKLYIFHCLCYQTRFHFFFSFYNCIILVSCIYNCIILFFLSVTVSCILKMQICFLFSFSKSIL